MIVSRRSAIEKWSLTGTAPLRKAQLDGLNLANMNEGALDALEAAYKRKKGGTIAGDYMASGRR